MTLVKIRKVLIFELKLKYTFATCSASDNWLKNCGDQPKAERYLSI